MHCACGLMGVAARRDPGLQTMERRSLEPWAGPQPAVGRGFYLRCGPHGSSLHQASGSWMAQDFKAATPRQNWNRKDDMA